MLLEKPAHEKRKTPGPCSHLGQAPSLQRDRIGHRKQRAESDHHPPAPAHDANKHQRCEDPRARPVLLRDRIDVAVRVVRIRALRPRRRVPDTRSARALRHRHGGVGDEVGLDDAQGAHLLAHARGAVPLGALGPLHAAQRLGVPARALRRGGGGGGAQLGHDEVVDEGGEFRGGGHPAREVGFEAEVVRVAGVGAFAGDFHHDAGGGRGGRDGGEEDAGCVEDAADAGLPDGVAFCLWGGLLVWPGNGD